MHRSYRRREFLKLAGAAAAGAAGVSATSRALAKPPPTYLPKPYLGQRLSLEPGSARAVPILDTHQHLWDLRRFRLPWLAEDSPIHKDFLMEDYLKATQRLNVVRSVYVEVGVEPSQQAAEAEWALGQCGRTDTPMAAAVIGGDPASPGFREYLARFKGNPHLRGVRAAMPPASGGRFPEAFVRGIRTLGSMGLLFEMNVGPERLVDCLKLVEACGDTRFVLDHCGNVNVQAKDRSQWEYDIAALGRHDRVACKISGIITSAKPGALRALDLDPVVKRCIDAFDWDRVMFGGDWPVCTLRAD